MIFECVTMSSKQTPDKAPKQTDPKPSRGVCIAELIYPGFRLSSEDKKWAFEIAKLISQLKSELEVAAVSLHLFINEQENIAQRSSRMGEVDDIDTERAMKRYQELIDRIKDESRADIVLAEIEKSKINEKREEWASGALPKTYEDKLIFVYAKSFILSVDMIGKLLKTLRTEPGVTEAVGIQEQEFYKQFPDLKNVRDSEMHQEERVKGKTRGKEIDIKPINTRMIKSDGKILVSSSLDGNLFSATMADGHLGQVEVSAESLFIARDCIQNVINAFQWEGYPYHHP